MHLSLPGFYGSVTAPDVLPVEYRVCILGPQTNDAFHHSVPALDRSCIPSRRRDVSAGYNYTAGPSTGSAIRHRGYLRHPRERHARDLLSPLPRALTFPFLSPRFLSFAANHAAPKYD